MRVKEYILIICLCFSISSFAQKKETDSTAFYKNAYDYSQKSKTKKFLYKLFFRESALDTTKTPKQKISSKNEYLEYQGKIIRNIYITTLDPFGYSITDTLKKPKKKIDKIGNSIHIKTKKFTIKNLLLFKENSIFDSLKISESERLIRAQRYTRKVTLTPIPTNIASDSVDIIVRVLDSWSLIPNGSLSSSRGNVKLAERNVLGLGHQLSGNYKYRFNDKAKAISANYTIANIKDSYIQINLGYDNDFDNNSSRNISINRDFYSPLTKWAGGLFFENKLNEERFYEVIADTIIRENIRGEFFEAWLGHSFKLNKNNFLKKDRTTRFITALTLNKTIYKQKPNFFLDPNDLYSNENNLIGHIGLTSQKYYQDKFLFNYDIIEDIPYGKVYALTMGFQEKNDIIRTYLGAKFAYGKRFSFGYLSTSAEYGAFFNSSLPDQKAFKAAINYFTNVIHIGNWRVRQFIKPSYIWGRNRFFTEKDYLTLNSDWGIEGFNSPITGTQKWVLNLQTQTYAPGAWGGFRFSPYFNATFGSLVNKEAPIEGKVYSKFSIGILLNNDYLVFNSFQISLSYYPTIPFSGDHIFKTNSFENDDLIIPDFQLSKPSYISYE